MKTKEMAKREMTPGDGTKTRVRLGAIGVGLLLMTNEDLATVERLTWDGSFEGDRLRGHVALKSRSPIDMGRSGPPIGRSLETDAGAPMSDSPIRHEKWNEIPREVVTDHIERQLFTGERMMLAHVYLEQGAIVPKHAHENEQLTWVVEGALRFRLGNEGEEGYEERVVSAGEVMYIPSNAPHAAEALEDTFDVDVFSPPRQDWLDGTDSYFHEK